MEFYAPFSSHSSLPSSPFSFANLYERAKQLLSFAVSAILGNLFSAIFTFFFALGIFLSLSNHPLAFFSICFSVIAGFFPFICITLTSRSIFFCDGGCNVQWIFGFCVCIYVYKIFFGPTQSSKLILLPKKRQQISKLILKNWFWYFLFI